MTKAVLNGNFIAGTPVLHTSGCLLCPCLDNLPASVMHGIEDIQECDNTYKHEALESNLMVGGTLDRMKLARKGGETCQAPSRAASSLPLSRALTPGRFPTNVQQVQSVLWSGKRFEIKGPCIIHAICIAATRDASAGHISTHCRAMYASRTGKGHRDQLHNIQLQREV